MPSSQTTTAAPASSFDLRLLLDEGGWSLTQKLMMVLAAFAIICDGIDIQLMGLAVPAIAKDWGIARGSFAAVLGLGLFGIGAGTAIGGILGDRFGRRKILIGSLTFLGLMTLGIAFTHTVHQILFLRFLVGAGIGAALPNATALTAECTPRVKRPIAITLTIVCIPLGGMVAGLVAARVLGPYGWRALFYLGGGVPLLLALTLFLALPESPRFLMRLPANRIALLNLMRRMGNRLPDDATFHDPVEHESRNTTSISAIFGKAHLRDTLTLWVAFCFTLLSVYLAFNWLPSLMTSLGYSLATASSSLAMYNLGGIIGALGFAWWISRIGSRIPLLCATAASVGSALVLRAMQMNPTHETRYVILALAIHGLFVNAVQTVMYALASHLYATRVRATGVAAALAIGRVGGILSAFLGVNLMLAGKNTYFLAISLAMSVVFVSLALMKNHISSTPVKSL